MEAPPNPLTLKHGSEPLHQDGAPLGATLLDFWRWSASDLLGNALRGQLAEFLVAVALRIPLADARQEWTSWDLTTPEGIRVEVKSSAYLQSWHQSKPSVITFSIAESKGWDPATNAYANAVQRQAQVYVFCLFAQRDKAAADPLNAAQWQFYVVPTALLNQHHPGQKRIGLAGVRQLAGPVVFEEVRERVVVAGFPS